MNNNEWNENELTLATNDEVQAAGTSGEVKTLVQELLKNGYIESASDPKYFNAVVRLRHDINNALEPLDLCIDLDELRGLVILRVAESAEASPEEAWSHPLVRRQRLTLEQSLMVAILRQFYVHQELESGVGVREIRISADELLSQLQVFLEDTGSDAKNRQRLLTLIEQLKPHGIVFEPDARNDVTIRPMITRLASPETLTALLAHYRTLRGHSENSTVSASDE